MRRPTIGIVAVVAFMAWCHGAAFGAEQSVGARLLEFAKKFRATAWSNGSCTGFNNPSDLDRVYAMLVTVDADSRVSTEERNGIVPMALPCANQVVRVALLSWPKDLLGGSYLIAVQLDGAVAAKSTPKFRVLGVAGNAPADSELEDAVFDLAARK